MITNRTSQPLVTAAEQYDAAKARHGAEVIRRYGRGNVAVQNGDVLDQAGLDALTTEGDDAIARLQAHGHR